MRRSVATLRIRSPIAWHRLATVAWLCAAMALAIIDPRHLETARRIAHNVLFPGQKALAMVSSGVATVQATMTRYATAVRTADRLDSERQRLEQENHQLRRQLEALRIALAEQSADEPAPLASKTTTPLVQPVAIEARLLGQQAVRCLDRHGLLELHHSNGVCSGDLVLDVPTSLLDVGTDLQVSNDDLLLMGSHVWGRIVRVGRWTAQAIRVDATQFRALASLAREDGRSTWRLGARGVLEGQGNGMCRLRFVPTTEPVEVGDVVLAADVQGLVEAPLVYGWVIEAQRDVGAAHWQIVVRAAACQSPPPKRLAVLRGRPNPQRLASRLDGTPAYATHPLTSQQTRSGNPDRPGSERTTSDKQREK